MGNMQNVKDFYNRKFSFAISTLKECSFDKETNHFLVDTSYECFNYDRINKSLVCQVTKSVDSLFFDFKNNILYFIEFKNRGFDSDKLKSELKEKGIDSILLHIASMRYVLNYDYVTNNNMKLVYLIVLSKVKDSVNYSLLIKSKLSPNNKNPYESFINEILNNGCRFFRKFDDVIICHDDNFEDYIKLT